MLRKLLIIVPLVLALILASLFLPARRVSIEGIGRLSIGQEAAYASPGWWNTDWQYRIKLTIAAGDIGSDLSNFPVLVHLSSSCGKGGSDLSGIFDGKTRDNGEDIRFVDSDDLTLLNYEIEKWDNSGEAWIWVRIPTISSIDDTEFYMYYGNPGASDGQNPTAVWNDDFVMVQHLQETSGTLYDSTSNDNDGTNYGAVYSGSGKVNGCYTFTDADRIQMAHNSTLGINQSITLEVFVYLNDKTDGKIIAKDDTDSGGCYCLQQENSNLELMLDLASQGWVHLSYSTYNTGEWIYLVGTYDRTMMRLYLNGEEKATLGQTKVISNKNINLALGNRADDSGTSYDLHGLIDEARISDTARSADWIKASYESGRDNLLYFGSEETPVISISVSPNTKDWGTVLPGQIYSSLAEEFTLSNTGDVAVNTFIQGEDATATGAPDWQLSDTATPSPDVYGLKFSFDLSNWVIIKKSTAVTFRPGALAVGTSDTFGLQLLTPTKISTPNKTYSAKIYITAVQE